LTDKPFDLDRWHMTRALELAAQGRGGAEPNPLVGCVIAHGAEVIGEGYHRRYGGPHAEVEALQMAGERARGATLYVTLEPCCHWGKTPPCSQAVIKSGVGRVVVAMSDPFPQVAGGGLAELKSAGVEVSVGLLDEAARQLNRPYLKLLATGRPWVIAKWAMTLDGKIATRDGSSQWISSPESRAIVHQLRGRVDAIIVAAGTVRADDPQLTARPTGPRIATRVVVDDRAELSLASQSVRTARETPVLVAVAADASAEKVAALKQSGCDVFVCAGVDRPARIDSLLNELGRRRFTNVLVEGGSKLLGGLLDQRQIDEVYAFIAPKLVGGDTAPSPIAGVGIGNMAEALRLDSVQVDTIGGDIFLRGQVTPSDIKKEQKTGS
jgi:diaminohydroxyphosphoribosylaminopyrimidine deaminase/5-amino-6-(5-phosphoribosylamino)uracil reductase